MGEFAEPVGDSQRGLAPGTADSTGRRVEVEANEAVAEVDDEWAAGRGLKAGDKPVRPTPAPLTDAGLEQHLQMFLCRRAGTADYPSQITGTNPFAS